MELRSKAERTRDTLIERYGKDYFKNLANKVKKPRGGKNSSGSFTHETGRLAALRQKGINRNRPTFKIAKKRGVKAINLNEQNGETAEIKEIS